jgi:hypothetical protein
VDDKEEDPDDSGSTSVVEQPITDHFIHVEVTLPQGE